MVTPAAMETITCCGVMADLTDSRTDATSLGLTAINTICGKRWLLVVTTSNVK
jgi:hypothetical protein